MKTCLTAVALVLLSGCGRSAVSADPRPDSTSASLSQPVPARPRATPRLGPLAGAGSGVRRVDVALR